MTVPYWVQDAIFYQIFPDRFANGSSRNDPPYSQPWGARPTKHGIQGGDLRGIIDKFDYLLEMEINAIYLNPIFQSPANHGYHTTDYFKIEPRFGDMQDFKALIDVAHSNGVKVILDGVFNHSGRGFFAFVDILENREHSPYKDWYHIRNFPIDAYSEGEAVDYRAWWGMKPLPKFNTDNPAVRKYLFEVARYWIEKGADGWRLDVPGEIDDDEFWGEFRRIVKSLNSNAYILGEIWSTDPRWVGDNHFDGLMNYPVRETLLSVLQSNTSVSKFADRVEELLKIYPRENVYAMYLPLGSHDTTRLLTKLGGDISKAKLAFFFQFSYPGAPAIYNGDEIGLQGGRDPENRGAFPWESDKWNHELRDWVKNLAGVRKRSAALRRGDYNRILANSELGTYVFSRSIGEESVLVVMNAGDKTRQLHIPVDDLGWHDGHVVRNYLSDARYEVYQGEITLVIPAWEGIWLS
jgi:glycosidase